MKNINIGIANLMVSNKLNDYYLNNNLIEESQKLTKNFFEIIKDSPILQLELKVFNNLENKNIADDLSATRYIDSNIKLFEIYTIPEIENEHKKLKSFIFENINLDLEKTTLYNAINNLILESLNDYNCVDIDNIHESFTIVLNHIKTKKQQLVENDETKLINEDVIQIAINKFNEKYISLNEDDRNLLKKLIKANINEKAAILEEYKTDCLKILESVNNDKINDKILKTINRIKEMVHKPNTVEFFNSIDDDIIGLHELKKGLL